MFIHVIEAIKITIPTIGPTHVELIRALKRIVTIAEANEALDQIQHNELMDEIDPLGQG